MKEDTIIDRVSELEGYRSEMISRLLDDLLAYLRARSEGRSDTRHLRYTCGLVKEIRLKREFLSHCDYVLDASAIEGSPLIGKVKDEFELCEEIDDRLSEF